MSSSNRGQEGGMSEEMRLKERWKIRDPARHIVSRSDVSSDRSTRRLRVSYEPRGSYWLWDFLWALWQSKIGWTFNAILALLDLFHKYVCECVQE